MNNNILEMFGIPADATTVYLAILNLKETAISEISKTTHLPRSSVIRYVKLLSARGLVNFFVQGKHKVILAEPLEKINQMLESEKISLEKAVLAIQKNVYPAKYHPRVFFYEGASEIKKIYQDMLAEQRPIDAITSPDDTYKVLGDFFDTFIQTRLSKKIPIRLLAPRAEQAIKFKESDEKFLRKTKFLKPTTPFRIASYIYGNKVAMVSLRNTNPSGIIIDDPIIADAQRTTFELIWNCQCSTLFPPSSSKK